jgi:predicted transcriptional regulator
MYAAYIVKRTQIYLDETQDKLLGKRARAAKTTKSFLIREAVDEYLARPSAVDDALARFRQAIADVAGVAPYLPPGSEYKERLRRADLDHEAEIERRWRK